MPARAVLFIPNGLYHVYNRGSEKRTIFQSDRDYTKFLERVKDNSKKYHIEVLCYCLMPNHFHFLVRQVSDTSITLFIKAIQLGHAKYFNTKYERVGPLFQGRFKAKSIQNDEYLLQVSAYIHRNPIAEGIDATLKHFRFGNSNDLHHLVSQLRFYPYSSYHEYLNSNQQRLSNPERILDYFSKTKQKLSYESFVENFVPDIEALYPILADSN